jgi:hypothetical protein
MMDSVAQYYSFKNRLINGNMLIWQRGTTTVNPQAGNANFYTADRWAVNRASNATGVTVSQSTDVPTGFKYSLKLQRTAANATLEGMYLFNSNESINTLDLAGQTVTLSFWAKAGANYSGGSLFLNLYNGTGTDQPVYSYTGSNAFGALTQAITTTWTRYTLTATVPSNATEIGFIMYWTPTGTAGVDDSVYYTGVQLEKGVTATSFDYRPYGTELQLCQRYYWKAVGEGFGLAVSAYSAAGRLVNPVPMRVATTISSATFTVNSGSAGTVTSVGQTVYGQTIYNSAANWTTLAIVSLSGENSAEL